MTGTVPSLEIPRLERTDRPNVFRATCDCGWTQAIEGLRSANRLRASHAVDHVGLWGYQAEPSTRMSLAFRGPPT